MAELLCEPGVGSKLGCKLFTSACHHDLDILGFSRGDVGEAELLPQPEGSLRDDEQGQCDSHAAPIIQAPRYLYLYRLQNVDVLLQCIAAGPSDTVWTSEGFAVAEAVDPRSPGPLRRPRHRRRRFWAGLDAGGPPRPGAADGTRWWNEQRVIVFTEFRHTQSWLHTLFTAAGLGGENGDRLSLLYGGMDAVERERIKAEFQYHPDSQNHPEGTRVRILLATDAASEGIDLQRHCHLMAHVEIPFSPTRLEQRNGRIDRHGQPAPEVSIHHFVGRGWEQAAAGSLEADLGFLSLVARKVESIRDDLGSVGEVLAEEVEAQLLGTRRGNVNRQPSDPRKAASRTLNRLERELRERTQDLRDQLSASVDELGLTPDRVERVVRTALDLVSQPPLRPVAVPRDDGSVARAFEVGALNRSWATATLNLRHPVTGAVLPITFNHETAKDADDVVLAHLGHRLVAQSMRLLRAEVWATGATGRLSRVCAKVAAVDQLTVVAHARLVLTGGDGHRLHEELIQAGGRVRGGRFARLGVGDVRAALDAATEDAVAASVQAELAALWDRISQPLADAIDARGAERADSLSRTLGQRQAGDQAAIRRVLTDLRATIGAQLDELEHESPQLTFDFNLDERAQLDRDVHALRRRIETIPDEIELETAAIARRYADPVARLFPAAVTFLVPPAAAFRTLAALP